MSTAVKILVLMSVLIFGNSVKAQCDCPKIKKEDGVVTLCKPNMVAYNKTSQVGLGAGKSAAGEFISVTIRFSGTAKEIKGKLTLWLVDGNSIDLEYENGGLAFIGNSQVAQGVFKLTPQQKAKLQKSKLKTVAFKLSDGLRYTYEVRSNANILMNHLKCL